LQRFPDRLPPTAPNARTGLLTPPGRYFRASSNAAMDFSVFNDTSKFTSCCHAIFHYVNRRRFEIKQRKGRGDMSGIVGNSGGPLAGFFLAVTVTFRGPICDRPFPSSEQAATFSQASLSHFLRI
jgi:hypothetical protein